MLSHKISLNQTVGTVLRQWRGPIKNRNWYSDINPFYSLTQDSGTGVAKLQGTADQAHFNYMDTSGGLNPFTGDLLPTEAATWTDIVVGSSGTTVQVNNISTEYWFLRIVIATAGTGNLTDWQTYWR